VGRLAGGIAHDFNNLLTVINGCADLLKGSIPPASSEATLVGDIATAGERAAALTNQLLMFSRKRAIACTAVDLNQAIAEADTLLRRVIGETITIERFPGENVPPILADPGLIHQVIFNLAVNARDAMPEGGTLVLATLRALDTAGNPMVRLLVSDTGCGMDEATQAHLFEPFFTTKDIGQGTGLGLATVYGIVQSLGGTIRFRSALDRGTVSRSISPPRTSPWSRRRRASRRRRVPCAPSLSCSWKTTPRSATWPAASSSRAATRCSSATAPSRPSTRRPATKGESTCSLPTS